MKLLTDHIEEVITEQKTDDRSLEHKVFNWAGGSIGRQAKVFQHLLKGSVLMTVLKNDPTNEECKVIKDINDVPMLIRREIEALITVPIIRAFIEEFGREKTLRILGKVIEELAFKAGKDIARMIGGNDIQHMLDKLFPVFSKGGGIEYEIVEQTPTRTMVHIKRCKYAEKYRELGVEEFGYHISCARDFALFAGFNPEIKYTRTQTIMEGGDYCDFCFDY